MVFRSVLRFVKLHGSPPAVFVIMSNDEYEGIVEFLEAFEEPSFAERSLPDNKRRVLIFVGMTSETVATLFKVRFGHLISSEKIEF